jgi:hypothetical protein
MVGGKYIERNQDSKTKGRIKQKRRETTKGSRRAISFRRENEDEHNRQKKPRENPRGRERKNGVT